MTDMPARAHTPVIMAAVVAGVALAACDSTQAEHATPDAYAYPGTVLWFTADHPTVREPGDVVDVGREPESLPPFVLDFDPDGLRYADGQVGEAACLLPGSEFALRLDPSLDLAQPMDYRRKSLAFWVRPEALTTEPTPIFTAIHGPNAGMQITVDVENTTLHAWDDNRNWHQTISQGALTENDWTHLALTLNAAHVDAARDGLRFYVDGHSGEPATAKIIMDQQGRLVFHAHGDAAVCFDEVALYMDALTGESVRDLYRYGLDH
nr:LamG-like jellyroll fold domain-containing protein [Natronocella acetinitrilica]